MTKKPDKIKNLLDFVKRCIDNDNYRDSIHAQERKAQRGITITEILYVLRNGWHEKKKDEFKEEYQSWNYAIRGDTVDEVSLRIIVSFEASMRMLIITAMYLTDRRVK